MSHFFAYLSRMKLINRWGLMRNTQNENIQEHSLQVALIAQCLAIIRNKLYEGKLNPDKVIALAMYHEVSEVITGDLATPIKYFNPDIKRAFGDIEEIARKRLFEMIPKDIRSEYKPYFFPNSNEEKEYLKLVKAADKLAAYLKCVEELKSGNNEFLKAKKKIEFELSKFELPEVKYFIDIFAPSFFLTLDELE